MRKLLTTLALAAALLVAPGGFEIDGFEIDTAAAGIHNKYVPNANQVQCTHDASYGWGGYSYYFSHHIGGGDHHAAVYRMYWWGYKYEGHWSMDCDHNH